MGLNISSTTNYYNYQYGIITCYWNNSCNQLSYLIDNFCIFVIKIKRPNPFPGGKKCNLPQPVLINLPANQPTSMALQKIQLHGSHMVYMPESRQAVSTGYLECRLLGFFFFVILKTTVVQTTEWLLKLTICGRKTHIFVVCLTIIGSDNGLLPGRHQAIIWSNAGILLIWLLGTHFSEISIAILRVPFKKMCFKWSSAQWRPFCLSSVC